MEYEGLAAMMSLRSQILSGGFLGFVEGEIACAVDKAEDEAAAQ